MAYGEAWGKSSSLRLLERAAPSLNELKPCYFFFGLEVYAAESFVERVVDRLRREAGDEVEINRFYLDESGWAEILDSARNALLFSAVRRVFIVRIPEKTGRVPKKRSGSGPRPSRNAEVPEDEETGISAESFGVEEDGEAVDNRSEGRFLDGSDKSNLKRYFADPAANVNFFIYRTGMFKSSDRVVRFFSSLPKSSVEVVELVKVKENQIHGWLRGRSAAAGKFMTEAARKRLVQVAGPNLRLLANELDKLAAFTGGRKEITEEDVDQVTAWLKINAFYDLRDSLLTGTYDESVHILNNLIDEGVNPGAIVGSLTGLIKNLALASAWSVERKMTRQEIFQVFYPQLKPLWDIYEKKFNGFFGRLDKLGRAGLRHVTAKLQEVDKRLKSTESSPLILLETFLFEYFRLAGN